MQQQIPAKVAMQIRPNCKWYLIKIQETEFAVQYTGPDPDIVFPVDITGIFIIKVD
jgi:hypothetical protein